MANSLTEIIKQLRLATDELQKANDEAEARELAALQDYNKTKESNDEQ